MHGLLQKLPITGDIFCFRGESCHTRCSSKQLPGPAYRTLYARYSAEKQHEAWCVALCFVFSTVLSSTRSLILHRLGTSIMPSQMDCRWHARCLTIFTISYLLDHRGGGSDHGRNKPSLCPQRHHWVVRPNLLFCIMQLLYIQNEWSAPRWHARFSLCFQWSRLTHPNHRRARRHRGSVMQSDATQISARVSNEWG